MPGQGHGLACLVVAGDRLNGMASVSIVNRCGCGPCTLLWQPPSKEHKRYHHSAAWPAALQLWGLSSALFSGRHAITACRHDVSGCPSGPLRPLIIISCHPFRITGLHCDSPKLTSPLSVVCNLVPLLMGSQLCFHCFLHRDI